MKASACGPWLQTEAFCFACSYLSHNSLTVRRIRVYNRAKYCTLYIDVLQYYTWASGKSLKL